jgi:hypothetical protein
MKQKDNVNKFKVIDLHNGIIVNIVDGRDGKIAEINVSGSKKKMPLEDIDALIGALAAVKQWLNESKL